MEIEVHERVKHAAILGGAFDPITRGHTQIAELVLARLRDVDEVWIMPCYRHAYDKRMAEASHRLAMCRLACCKLRNTKVLDYEIRKKWDAGTYFLIKELLAEEFVKGSYRLSLAIGLDNANGFEQWIEYEKLMNLVPFIVVPRQGVKRVPGTNWYTRKPHVYIDDERIMNVSSTRVRSLVRDGRLEEALALLDPDVMSYIVHHGLYV
jgi:nicotinate-nucleotide adenylyltransferase